MIELKIKTSQFFWIRRSVVVKLASTSAPIDLLAFVFSTVRCKKSDTTRGVPAVDSVQNYKAVANCVCHFISGCVMAWEPGERSTDFIIYLFCGKSNGSLEDSVMEDACAPLGTCCSSAKVELTLGCVTFPYHK